MSENNINNLFLKALKGKFQYEKKLPFIFITMGEIILKFSVSFFLFEKERTEIYWYLLEIKYREKPLRESDHLCKTINSIIHFILENNSIVD